MHYYQFNIGDYRRDTQHLTPLEHGIYRLLLDQFYLTELPIDANALRLLCIRTDGDVQVAKAMLSEFFTEVASGLFVHKRASKEIDKYHDKSIKAADSARKRWNDANAMRTHSEGNANHKPITNNQEPLTKNHIKPKSAPATQLPDWLPESTWNDYLECRKVMKAPMTDRAKQLAINKLDELRKSGSDPEKVLSQSIYNGWKGLFAIKPEAINQPKKETYREQLKRTSDALCGRNRNNGTPVIDGTAERVD